MKTKKIIIKTDLSTNSVIVMISQPLNSCLVFKYFVLNTPTLLLCNEKKTIYSSLNIYYIEQRVHNHCFVSRVIFAYLLVFNRLADDIYFFLLLFTFILFSFTFMIY